MDLIRTDLVAIYDLRFDRVDQIPWPLLKNSVSRIASRLKESFGWMFYGEELRNFDVFDLSQVVPDCIGAALRINRQASVGSLMVWRLSNDEKTDPLALKLASWKDGEHSLLTIEQLFKGLRGDRIYPFLSIQANTATDELDDFAKSHAVDLGRLLTSDLEGERPSTLKQCVESDLSRRAYEKLFLRWTEALAVYARLDSDEFYENCMFRAVQIFEHCILGQVSLVSALERMDSFSRRLLLVTPRKWFRARALFASLADAEYDFVVYPQTSSVEANRLLLEAQKQFGLSNFLTSAKAKGAELRDQFEWAKTQTLGLIAVVTYLLDKIIGWEGLKNWVWTLFRRF